MQKSISQKCITRTDETIIDDAEDLDLVMLMYNLLHCSLDYFVLKIKQLTLMLIM